MFGFVLLVAVTLAATGCATKLMPPRLPETVAGGFKKTQGMGLRAVYSGPAVVTVTLTEMESSGNAFEAIQKWKPEAGRMPFQRGKYFGVAESKELDAKALGAFVTAVERELAK